MYIMYTFYNIYTNNIEREGEGESFWERQKGYHRQGQKTFLSPGKLLPEVSLDVNASPAKSFTEYIAFESLLDLSYVLLKRWMGGG